MASPRSSSAAGKANSIRRSCSRSWPIRSISASRWKTSHSKRRFRTASDTQARAMNDLLDFLAPSLLNSRADAIVVADRRGIIRFWNPGAERIFGHPRSEALGQSLDLIIPEPLRARHWAEYKRVMDGGESRYGEGDLLAVPGLRNDGARISLEFTIVPMVNASGSLIGITAVMRDVTARFEEMRALRRRLREASITNNSPA